MNSLRSFIAIPLPQDIINSFCQAQENLRRKIQYPVKWVKPASMHITLKFLGDTTTTQIAQITDIMEQMPTQKPFTIEFREIGMFPERGSPRVIWIGIVDSKAKLAKLHIHLDRECSKLGFAKEKRKYSPHITLGRIKQKFPATALLPIIEQQRQLVFGSALVNSFTLYKSELSSRGAIYTPLAKVALNGS